MNGQVNATIAAYGNGGRPERTSPEDDHETVAVEPVAVEAASDPAGDAPGPALGCG